MARNTKIVTITDEGRDKGKTYLLTEMPASQAEEWATRALLLAAQSGADIPADIRDIGMQAIAIAGVQTILGGVKFQDVKPLLAEMFQCVMIIPDLKKSSFARPLIEDDIEEVGTRLHLRDEVLSLHLGFSVADAISTLTLRTSATSNLLDTQTSPLPSV